MKIICVGRNYAAHAAELSNAVPGEPVIFMKAQNALLRPGSDFYYPDFTRDLHYECEVVYRVSKNGKHIAEKFAHSYVNAVTVGIDFTARDIQQKQKEAGLPWEIAKAFDNSAVLGTFTDIPSYDPQALHFTLEQNGSVVQTGDTSLMLFPLPRVISYVSAFFSLNVGDLIFTGTPAGVGPVQPGDRLEGYLAGEKKFSLNIR